jgi:L,D-transpeptidase catalytic domain
VRLLVPLLALLTLTGCSRHDSSASAATAEAPSVAASGSASPTIASTDTRFPGRLAARAFETKIYSKPSSSSKTLGYLRAGAVVSAAASSSGNDGCSGGWYAVAPTGYVCLAPDNASTDPNDPVAVALSRRADTSARLPYMYGVVRKGGPIYGRPPTRAEAQASEIDFDAHMKEWLAAAGEDGASFRPDYWMRWKGHTGATAQALWDASRSEDVPAFLAGAAFPPGNVAAITKSNALVVAQTKHHNGMAFVDTFALDGRRYGMTTDLLFFPVDRMRPIEGSTYHGFRIPDDIDFPFAIIRRDGASLYAYDGGHFEKVKDIARRVTVKLTGHKSFFHHRMYYETVDHLYVSDEFASFFDKLQKAPKWAKETNAPWIEVSIGRQSLIAYEGEKAVYATVVSTGEAGLEDPETSKSTKTGIFRIHTKHLTTTMASDVVGEEFELKDIPYVQYFEAGYALHAAYWHDDFGTPRSHGCINLSPEDAKWLFQWTEPKLPDGWHGVRKALTGSTVFVHP